MSSTTPRVEITEELLRSTWEAVRHDAKRWPPTFEAVLEDPIKLRLLRIAAACMARGRFRAKQSTPPARQAARQPHPTPTKTAPAPRSARPDPSPQLPLELDRKRAASGERDDD